MASQTSTTRTLKSYALNYRQLKTLVNVALLVIGSFALPQLCHLFPHGGVTWLPLYFFTLLAAYRYGYTTGLLFAVLSPLLNSLLFDMPTLAAMPVILVKSVVLVLVAATLARELGRVTLWAVALSVVAYQVVGGLAEWMLADAPDHVFQDLLIGYPGLLLQVAAGYLMLRFLLRD